MFWKKSPNSNSPFTTSIRFAYSVTPPVEEKPFIPNSEINKSKSNALDGFPVISSLISFDKSSLTSNYIQCKSSSTQKSDFQQTLLVNIDRLEVSIFAAKFVSTSNTDELFKLYDEAKKFFNADTSKLDHYNRKINALRDLPTVKQAYQKQATSNQSANALADFQKNELKSKLELIQNQPEWCVTEDDVHHILDTQDDKMLEQEVVIEKDLKKQTNMIQKRLSKRIKANQSNMLSSSIRLKSLGCSESTEGSSDLATDRPQSQRYSVNSKIKTISYLDRLPEIIETPMQPDLQINQQPNQSQYQQKSTNKIIIAFVNDKKRAIQEEKALKLERLDFQYEKLIYEQQQKQKLQQGQSSGNSSSQVEYLHTIQTLQESKLQRASEIEAEFHQREMEEIQNIYAEYLSNENDQSHQSSDLANSIQVPHIY